MNKSQIKSLLSKGQIGKQYLVCGWLKTRRDSKGGYSFLEVNDGSCLRNLQIIAEKNLDNYNKEILNLYPGAALKIQGSLVESPGCEQTIEMHAENIEVCGFCDIDEYPLKKQRIPFDKLREYAHLRARTNTFGAITRVRNAMSFATHQFFQDRDFNYINTPIITTNDCEGAGQMFKVTTLDIPKLIGQTKVDDIFADDFFGEGAGLAVSGQLEAETIACALGNVYTFGPTFRAENSNTSRHLAEFWMVEPEMAFATLKDDISLAEEYLKFIFSHILNHCSEDMEFFNLRIEKTIIERLKTIIENEFQIIPYKEAIKILDRHKKKFKFPVIYGMDLKSEHERFLVENEFRKPIVIIDFPKEIKPFYMRVNDDNETVAAMDVLLPGIGEIIGGSQREERLDIISSRMVGLGLNLDQYRWYLDLRRFGTVPHSGFGVGFERLVQFCTGMSNIRDVIPYPRTPRNAKF